MLQVVEYRARLGGDLVLKMPLYEFLQEIHDGSRLGARVAFEDLRVMVNGQELMPTDCAHA